jgi:hypothetical protein
VLVQNTALLWKRGAEPTATKSVKLTPSGDGEIAALYGTKMFITVFTTAHLWTLS